jgi:para-nitrobenzyl esterase
MKKELGDSLGSMNRRALLTRGAALAGGLVASAGLKSYGQQPAAAKPTAAKPVGGANLRPPVATVKGGKLRGFVEDKIYTFRGIPYAVAERFELPQPVPAWQGVLNAQSYGPVCAIQNLTAPSKDEFVFPHRYWSESEHCQNLNVWTPTLDKKAKKPVMVWMHGGGFSNGSAVEAYAYDGRNLSEFGDVVVVSVNHRLNILGTLDLSAYGEKYAKSRYTGTADLVTALQWIHDNIENFGGDPGSVMIFGQSGGGGKVIRMMHTPAAKGLFHRVTAESGGTTYFRDTTPAESIKTQQAIAAHTLANLSLTGAQIDELKKVPYDKLIAAGTEALKQAGKELGRELTWEVIADDQYVMREYCDWANSIPLMAGYNFSEHVGTMDKGVFDKNDWTEAQVDAALTKEFGANKDAVVAEFKKVFPEKRVQDVIFFSAVSRPIIKRALRVKLEQKAPVYHYLFNYEAEVNGGTTPFHCAEITFAFHNVGLREPRIATGGTPSAFALQDKVSRAWVNFAKTGNPSQPDLEWKAYTEKDPQTMIWDVNSGSRALLDDKLVELMTKKA